MAKQQQGSSTRRQAAERADQVRSAVEEAFQSASSQLTKERAQEIADELSSAADRVREALEQLRPPTGDDVRRHAGPARIARAAGRRARDPGPREAGREEARRRRSPRREEAGREEAGRRRRSRRRRSRGEEAGGEEAGGEEARSAARELRRHGDGCRSGVPEGVQGGHGHGLLADERGPGHGPEAARTPTSRSGSSSTTWTWSCNVRAGRDGEDANLHWEWSDDVDWEPKVQMKMSAEVAVRYFQGKENVPVAIARRRIKTGGDVKAALALIPITKPVYAQFRGGPRGPLPAPARVGRPARRHAGPSRVRGRPACPARAGDGRRGRAPRRRDARRRCAAGSPTAWSRARRASPARRGRPVAVAHARIVARLRDARPLAAGDPARDRRRAGSPSATSRSCCPTHDGDDHAARRRRARTGLEPALIERIFGDARVRAARAPRARGRRDARHMAERARRRASRSSPSCSSCASTGRRSRRSPTPRCGSSTSTCTSR